MIAGLIGWLAAGGYFYAGWHWAWAVRERPRAVLVPVCADESLGEVGAKLRELSGRARLLGPGMMAYFHTEVVIDVAVVTIGAQCLGSQFAAAPEVERHR